MTRTFPLAALLALCHLSALPSAKAAPLLEGIYPLAESVVANLASVEVIFSENVTNVTADDLLINGVAATSVSEIDAAQYVFEFPEPAAGRVQISWSAGHGIASTPGNEAFVETNWSYSLEPSLPLARVIISEFMADNDKTLNDEDGESSDWIELFNAAEVPVDLSGCFLSNDASDLAKWRFPAVSIAANGYLVVFASEKNRTNPAAKLHTNFKLAKEGAFLAFSTPGTNVVSAFAPQYPAQREDVSYGRERGGAAAGYFPKPTPGTANVPSGAGFAPEVLFSRRGGTYFEPFELTLSTRSTNAVIRYTIGKVLPTESSAIYEGPIPITNSMQVRARAFASGLLPGDPQSELFLRLSNTVRNVTSDLPLVILHNYGAGVVPTTGEQFVMMQVFEPKHGVASLTNQPDLSQRARFRKRGSSTEGLPKSSFALETWNEFGDDENVALGGMPEESDWVFYAPNQFEPVLIHNPFMYQLSRSIGRYAPRTRFVEVYLNTAGGLVASNNYYGIFAIEEKIKRGAERVNVAKLEPEHLKAPEVTGGYMLKIDRSDPGDSSFSAANQGSMNFVDPKGAEIRLAARDPQEQYIRSYLAQFGSALFGTNFRDPMNGYAKYIDVPSWIDHHILNVLAFNVDGLRLSTYFYKPRDGKIEFGPIWDFDRALGSTDGRDANPKVWSGSGGTEFFRSTGDNIWWGRLFLDPDFYQNWIDRWEELRREQFAQTNLNRLIDQLANEVRAAQPRELARWRVTPRGGSYNAEVNRMKNFLQSRAEFIDTNFVRPPVLSLPAGTVAKGTLLTLAQASNNTIYYTLNGNDPRLPGGAISPEALIYTGAIPISGNARVLARAQNPLHRRGPLSTTNSPWSGLIAGTFVVEMPKLAVTEIMYNPGGFGAFTNQDFEFIELKNTGTNSIDLAGVSIGGGVQFRFSGGSLGAGEYVVVVKNRGTFEARYGSGVNVAGEFTGTLDNSGDRITLSGALQELIAEIVFKDSDQPLTDGLGFSLVPLIEGATNRWVASSRVGGSPGRMDPSWVQVQPILVNEVLALPGASEIDKVELYNPNAAAIPIAGWYLSDDFNNPKRYKFPAGTSVPGGGYLVVDEAAFNKGTNAFAFGAKGDAAYLFSADASGELTGYFHGFSFGASTRGVSFGRHVTSDGREVFPAQAISTFGAANAGPRMSLVTISEIMFQPATISSNDNTLDEFIELSNNSAQPVALFDLAHPESTWRVRGGVSLDLPAGVTLGAGETILLVNFDPQNSVFAAGFRGRLKVPAETRIYGPYSGKLSNSRDAIRLLRPEPPDLEGTAYSVAEEVTYSAERPWPGGAAGTGNSLQRSVAGSYADDPVSWQSDLPTPGGQSRQTPVPDADGDGLPAAWEGLYGLNPNDATGVNGALGDPDGDGMTNLEEFLAGTVPIDPESRLKIDAISGTGGTWTIRFRSAAGISYSVQARNDLASGAWEKVAEVAAGEARANEVQDRSAPAGRRFYRVVTPKE